jgi:hypothetical protein
MVFLIEPFHLRRLKVEVIYPKVPNYFLKERERFLTLY